MSAARGKRLAFLYDHDDGVCRCVPEHHDLATPTPQPDVQAEREAYREFFMQLAGLMDACGRHRLHMDGIFKKWDRIRRGDFAPAQKEGG